MPNPDHSKVIGSVASAFRILEALVKSGGPMALADIAETCGSPKSSTHRMLASLARMGYVEQERSSRYRLTFKMVEMGMEVLSSVDIVKAARTHLEALVKATNENAYLAVLDEAGNSVYLARVETSRPVRVHSQLGVPNPSWGTATGRAMLAFLPETREKVLAGKLRALVPTTVTDPNRLRALLAEVARLGVAVARAQVSPDTGGIAAPIRDFNRCVIASCGISVPLHRMNTSLVHKCIPLVVRAAHAISMEMGMPDTHGAKRPRVARKK